MTINVIVNKDSRKVHRAVAKGEAWCGPMPEARTREETRSSASDITCKKCQRASALFWEQRAEETGRTITGLINEAPRQRREADARLARELKEKRKR